MPYVSIDDRTRLDSGEKPETAGELNYLITKTVDVFLNRKPINYASLNEAMGVLECAKLELYRRIVAEYEDTKIVENGDVYAAEI